MLACRFIAAAALLTTLAAFATSCARLPHQTVDALPPNLRERVEVGDAEPEPGGAAADQRTGGARKQLVLRARRSIATEAKGGLLVVPLVESAPGRSWGTPGLTRSPWSDEPDEVTFLFDTGGDFHVGMERSGARRLRPWLSAEIGRVETLTASGPSHKSHGVLAGILVGDAIAIMPAAVRVTHGDGPRADPMLGIEFLERFAGAIFNWPAGELLLLLTELTMTDLEHADAAADAAAARKALAADERWVSAPWEQSGAGTELSRQRMTPVSIQGRTFNAVLDTGAEGDLISWVDLDVEGPPDKYRMFGGASWMKIRAGPLAGPVRCGELEWDDVTAELPLGEAPHESLSMLIGIGLLSRQPVWLDFETDTVRFWRSPDPLPIPRGP